MNGSSKILGICLIVLLTSSCSTMQSRHIMLGRTYAAREKGAHVEVFHNNLPQRPFERISRLDVHLEKSHFIGSDLDNALPLLKDQARLSGADAIIEVKERFSRVVETKIYHVTAIGIKYTD